VDQQDLVLQEFLFLSFGPLTDSSLVSYCFGFENIFLSVDFIYFVYPCSVETSRGSILFLWSFSYFVLPFVPLRQKGRVFVSFRPEMYFQTGQVFLSKNGQRVSL
jgi:hypothetical protein